MLQPFQRCPTQGWPRPDFQFCLYIFFQYYIHSNLSMYSPVLSIHINGGILTISGSLYLLFILQLDELAILHPHHLSEPPWGIMFNTLTTLQSASFAHSSVHFLNTFSLLSSSHLVSPLALLSNWSPLIVTSAHQPGSKCCRRYSSLSFKNFS